MARIKRRQHKPIFVFVEEELLELTDKYSPFSRSRTVEIALRDWLQKHFGISYKLLEEREYDANIDEQIKEASEYYEKVEKEKPDLEIFKKLLR